MAKLVFYGRFADYMGREQIIRLGGEKPLNDLLVELARENLQFADAMRARVVKFAVNDAIAPLSTIVTDADEIAVLPPFSGG